MLKEDLDKKIYSYLQLTYLEEWKPSKTIADLRKMVHPSRIGNFYSNQAARGLLFI